MTSYGYASYIKIIGLYVSFAKEPYKRDYILQMYAYNMHHMEMHHTNPYAYQLGASQKTKLMG